MTDTILLQHGTIITLDAQRRIIKDGSLFIEGDQISAVGTDAELSRQHTTADYLIDASHQIILPGLINSHCHSAECLERYLGADLDLLSWLTTSKWPFQSALTPKDAYQEARLGLLENLRCGVTTVLDNYYPPKTSKRNVDQLIQVAQEYGIRYILARGCHDNPETTPDIFCESPHESLAEYQRLHNTFHGQENGRIQIAVAPVNLRNTTPESLHQLGDFAKKHQLLFHTHVSESQRDVEEVKQQYGKPYLEVFQEYGVLNHRFHGAHSIWVTPKEIQLIAETQAHVIYCPTSNMYVGLGICPVSKYQEQGTNIALGTDTQSVTGNLDMLNHLNMGALLQKVASLDPQAISAQQLLEMATINGARALGILDEVGSLEPGKKADLITIDTWEAYLQPVHDPVAAVVYGATAANIDSVIVDGRLMMHQKQFVQLNEDQIIQDAVEAAQILKERVISEKGD